MIASQTRRWSRPAVAGGKLRTLLFMQNRRMVRTVNQHPSPLDPLLLSPIWRAPRGPGRPAWQSFYSTVVIHNRPRQRVRWFFNALAISTVSFAIGAYLAINFSSPFLALLMMGSVPTHSDTLSMYQAPNEACQKIDQHIKDCPLAKDLRTYPEFQESRPHLQIPEAIRPHNFTGGTLAGPGMIAVPPYMWTEKQGKQLVSIFYLGNNVSGHPGIVHGGLLATMLDEGLARCCFPALPNRVGVTANLQINYKQPTKADQYLVLRAKTTRVEGRKAFVEGHIETMPEDGEEAEILVSANALFIEPRGASMLQSLYKATSPN